MVVPIGTRKTTKLFHTPYVWSAATPNKKINIEKTITILIFSVPIFLKRVRELFRLRGFNIWNL